MKIFLTFFVCIFINLLFDAYQLCIKDWQETFLALICSFSCGMFFGEYLILRRQRKELFGELDSILNNYNE